MRRAAAFGAPALVLGAAALLSGCGNNEDQLPQPRASATVEAAKGNLGVEPVTEGIGTPMAERVAVIGFLNKRNGKSQDYELKPGESVRIGNQVIIRLRACEKTAPWETYADAGGFVQLFVNAKRSGQNGPDQFKRVFSGWLFKNHPAANVVESGLYDVWVKDCRMSFPGEDAELDGVTTESPSGANSRSSEDQSPTVQEAPDDAEMPGTGGADTAA